MAGAAPELDDVRGRVEELAPPLPLPVTRKGQRARERPLPDWIHGIVKVPPRWGVTSNVCTLLTVIEPLTI